MQLKTRPKLFRIAVISLWFYVVILPIWLIFREVIGDESFFVLVLDYLGFWLVLPLLFFVPLTLINRYVLGLIGLLVPFSIFLSLYGSLFIPTRFENHRGEANLTIMSFNVRYDNTEFMRLTEVILSADADVLALQEFTRAHNNNIGNELTRQYPYKVESAASGLAIFSRYPILSQDIIETADRDIQSVELLIDKIKILLLNAHLTQPGIIPFIVSGDTDQITDRAAIRSEQISDINQEIQTKDLPIILACDCNLTDLTGAYRSLSMRLIDAYSVRGSWLGNTFILPRGFELPSSINLPFQRIDYLFHSPELHVNRIKVVGADSGSDHRPVLAQFELGEINQ